MDPPAPFGWEVDLVEVLEHLVLAVRFRDGTSGEVRFDPASMVGVFEGLKDPTAFRQVGVTFGAVTWESGVDLDPKHMHDQIVANGGCVIYP
ncbi:MAG: DUF2442 domain-containing protein [Marichromatium sp.]|nr:DUF2442 domain-containing protein [Marichromatium sp.]